MTRGAERVARLVELLKAEEKLYVELRDALQHEQACLVDLDTEGLDEAVRQKETLVSEARMLEGSRVALVETLTAELGLEAAGVKLDAGGAIVVDRFSCSSVPSIHAVGDVTDRVNLTPVAIHEGMALAHTLFGGRPTPVDHENVPSAVFSQPPLGTVGLTEEQARERHAAVDVYRSEFRPLLHTLSGRSERSLMKLVVDRSSDRVLGVHVVGEHAGEILQGFAVAVKMGATKAQLDATIGIHPTVAEELVTYQRVHPCPLETCGCVASMDKVNGKLTLWGTFQAPHAVRTVASLITHIPEHNIRIVSPDIGGGFGNKVGVYPG